MDKTFQDSIDINYYLYFAQSFDILFYDYGFKKSNKLTKKVGHMGHYKNTQAFFLNTINLTKKSTNPIHLKYFKSFLYGFLTHYILDAKFHPYIFYHYSLYCQEFFSYIKSCNRTTKTNTFDCSRIIF